MRNIIVVNFEQGRTEANAYDKVWQYNYGQTLRIQGLKLPRNVEIHFATQRTGGIAIPRVGVTRDGVTDVVIPDSMLENGDTTSDYPVYAFVYLTDETSGQTEYMIRMQIKSRPRPEVPGGSEDPGAFHEAVQEVRKLTEKATESERQAEGWAHGREDLPERTQDNAKYYAEKTSEDAQKTAADRTAVESVVQDVTQMQGDVERDLEQVQKFTGQAQTSAANAALSEQAAKTAETNAQTAQAGAETAEGNAELAEQGAKASEQAVEKAKQLVTQMGQEVLGNKNHVDQTVQAFTLTTQQALADVNNAGQTQTERVQGAGETAVENIQTAQNTATKAVETAKTEAIEAIQTEGTAQTGNVTKEGEKQVQAVQQAAQEIVADREQIQMNKEGVAKLKKDISNKITKFYASNQGETHITDSDNGKIQDMMLYGKSSQDGTPTPENPVEIKSVVNPTVKVCGKNFYPGSDLIRLTEAYVTDFIPVILHKGEICISFDAFSDTSNGNYLINVEYLDANKESMGSNGRADLVGNNISHINFNFNESTAGYNNEALDFKNVLYVKVRFYIYADTATEITYKNIMISATDSDFEPYKPIQTVTIPYTLNAIPVKSGGNVTIDGQQYIADYVDVDRGKLVRIVDSSKLDNTQSIVDKTEWLLADPQEIDFTTEEITAFKALVTYYPTTNISVNSEQLDGYTVFNYPISMANGWNYVKKQLNDNRDYIYDMDIQSAEAYVNSEYAVALTELEV